MSLPNCIDPKKHLGAADHKAACYIGAAPGFGDHGEAAQLDALRRRAGAAEADVSRLRAALAALYQRCIETGFSFDSSRHMVEVEIPSSYLDAARSALEEQP